MQVILTVSNLQPVESLLPGYPVSVSSGCSHPHPPWHNRKSKWGQGHPTIMEDVKLFVKFAQTFGLILLNV